MHAKYFFGLFLFFCACSADVDMSGLYQKSEYQGYEFVYASNVIYFDEQLPESECLVPRRFRELGWYGLLNHFNQKDR